jgi:hypothetical protein
LAYRGYFTERKFNSKDDFFRHFTATLSHIQLVIGMFLYTKSPLVKHFFVHFKDQIHDFHTLFFGVIHVLLMLTAVVIVTIGSALAKRDRTDKDKYRTMLLWFLAAFITIMIAIPWPFSPIASRPYFRLW